MLKCNKSKDISLFIGGVQEGEFLLTRGSIIILKDFYFIKTSKVYRKTTVYVPWCGFDTLFCHKPWVFL